MLTDMAAIMPFFQKYLNYMKLLQFLSLKITTF